MFLRLLNNEQKELVLGLAKLAANANGIVEESEKMLIVGFADEMGIDRLAGSTASALDICQRLVSISSQKELIQISFEILSVMLGDNQYDSVEKKFMADLNSQFGISEEVYNDMVTVLKEYSSVIKRIRQITEM